MFKSAAVIARRWCSLEAMLPVILFAVLSAEALVLLVMHFEFGDPLSKLFAMAGRGLINISSGSWNWAYKMSGPVLIPLLVLTILGIWSVRKLFACWQQTDEQIIEKAGKKYGQQFAHLWAGRMPKRLLHEKGEEEICRMIAHFANNDRQRIDRIFRRSKLYRPQWDSRIGPIAYNGQSIMPPINVSDIKIQMSLSSRLETHKYYSCLDIIIAIGAIFGFIGTCLSLILVMHHIDPNLVQSDMLKVLIDNSSSAYGSTIYGLSLFILAYLFEKLFKEFLIKENSLEPTFKIKAYLNYIQGFGEVKLSRTIKPVNKELIGGMPCGDLELSAQTSS